MAGKRIGALAILLFAACSGQHEKVSVNDTLLAATVKAKLVAVDADALTNVRVTASAGTVTLTGQARDPVEKDRYGMAARSVNGVTSVDDRVTVNPDLRGVREQSGDVALTTRVSAAVAAQTGVNVLNLKISSRAGVVSVSGRVPSSSVEQTIVETARRVAGVRRVNASITVDR